MDGRFSFDIDGIEITAELDVPEGFLDLLNEIALGFREPGPASPPPSVIVRQLPDGQGFFVAGSAFMQPFTCPYPADAASAVVAGLVGSYGQRHATNFCFHGAAVEIQGMTFLVPAVYRAGKSGLVMALRRLGCTVLSDDAVIYDPDLNELKSFGMPVRLRADFPQVCSQSLREFISAHTLHAGKRYIFVDAQTAGHSRKLAGFLFLKRNGASPPVLSKISADKALTQVIWHNLARSAPPSNILARFAGLVETLPCLELEYDNAEGAAAFLNQISLQDLPQKAPGELASHTRSNDADLAVLEGAETSIIADDRNGRIYQLNNSAYVMWKVARNSQDMEEAVELLTALYPDLAVAELTRDFLAVVERLKASDLLEWPITGPGARP